MRANVVTKADVETFTKMGCIQCIIWKMRRSPVKTLTDATPAPIGKKWSYDTLSLKTEWSEDVLQVGQGVRGQI